MAEQKGTGEVLKLMPVYEAETGKKPKDDPEAWKEWLNSYDQRQADALKISDEDINKFYSEMLKMLSTQGQSQKNQAMGYAAYNRLPYSVTEAQNRGIDYNTMLAGQKGLTDLKQWQIGTNIESERFLRQLQMQKELAEMQNDFSWQNLLYSAVGGVGTGLGYSMPDWGLFKSAPPAEQTAS